MDRARGEAALLELLGDVGGRPLGATEDHRESAALGLQYPRDHLRLVHGVRAVDELLDVGQRHALALRRGGADVRGLRHVAAGQGDDGAGHGRGEEHGLPAGRQHADDLLDVGEEAEVQHLVGLVEDQAAHVREVQLLLPGQVEQSAGGADDHVDTLLQGLDLRLVGTSAVDRGDAHVAHLAGGQQVVGDLDAQFAGGHHDEGLRGVGDVLGAGPARLYVGGDADALEERKAEAQRLAGAGLGLADDVAAGERDGERHLLDGEGVEDADGLKGLGRLGKDSELSESRSQGAASSVCAARGERGGRVVRPCRGRRPASGAEPGGTGRDHSRRSRACPAGPALVPLRDPPGMPYTRCRTAEKGCLVGADRATDRASSFKRPVAYQPGQYHHTPDSRTRQGRFRHVVVVTLTDQGLPEAVSGLLCAP
ncbi:hypothetical protein B0E37_03445 [Streptomyces sp. MH192]|nr:hypothetical protein [Streptomyces sp. MH192]MCF0103542.1 hypothetical protein [Streptomyces sp. MH191]